MADANQDTFDGDLGTDRSAVWSDRIARVISSIDALSAT